MNKKGFTLIELLVVVAIIGVLASIVLSSLNAARSKARDAKRITELKQIQTALELYYNDHGAYPNIFCESVFISSYPYWNSCWATLLSGYISSMPIDPINLISTYNWYSYIPNTNPHGCSQLTPGDAPGKYVLTARLENPYSSVNYCATSFSNQIDNPAVNYILSP